MQNNACANAGTPAPAPFRECMKIRIIPTSEPAESYICISL